MWWDFVDRTFDDDDINAINEIISFYRFSSLNVNYKKINQSVVNLVKVFRLVYDYGDIVLEASVSHKIRRKVKCILFDNGHIKAEDMENSVCDLPCYVEYEKNSWAREISNFKDKLEREFYRYCVNKFTNK